MLISCQNPPKSCRSCPKKQRVENADHTDPPKDYHTNLGPCFDQQRVKERERVDEKTIKKERVEKDREHLSSEKEKTDERKNKSD